MEVLFPVVASMVSAIILGTYSLLHLLLLGLATSGCIAIFMLVEILGHSVLPLELFPRSLGKMCYRITCQSHLGHCVEDSSVGDVVATHQNFTV